LTNGTYFSKSLEAIAQAASPRTLPVVALLDRSFA
jgi:hypothetical protein